MAKVRYPLWSLSAQGSVGNSLCYSPVEAEKGKRIARNRAGKVFTAEYPPRNISGRGVVRLKPQQRGDLRAKSRGGQAKDDSPALRRQSLFTAARRISRWLIEQNACVATDNPLLLDPTPYPWWDGVYTQRRQSSIEAKFPGQAVGRSLDIRREIMGTVTPHGYIMRQMLSRTFFRFEITLRAFQNLSDGFKASWEPTGDVDWMALENPFPIMGFGKLPRAFINLWIQASFQIANFSLRAGWLLRGTELQVWRSPLIRPDSDPVVVAWRNHLASAADFTEIDVQQWQSKNGVRKQPQAE